MSGKPVKPPATKNRSAAVGFVTQALAYTVGAASIRPLANDVENNERCMGVGNDCTSAQLLPQGATCVAELGPAGIRQPFLDLQFPRRAVPQQRPARTPTATYVVHFFPANFELHLYNVGK
jgi:hypothetical protein